MTWICLTGSQQKDQYNGCTSLQGRSTPHDVTKPLGTYTPGQFRRVFTEHLTVPNYPFIPGKDAAPPLLSAASDLLPKNYE
jgi:hypothetical protein